MRFEWDDAKAAANRRKHGVSFEEAKSVLEHPLAITVADLRHSGDEDREKTVGPSDRGRILVVIHTRPTRKVIRIISARRASRREIADYAEEISERLAED